MWLILEVWPYACYLILEHEAILYWVLEGRKWWECWVWRWLVQCYHSVKSWSVFSKNANKHDWPIRARYRVSFFQGIIYAIFTIASRARSKCIHKFLRAQLPKFCIFQYVWFTRKLCKYPHARMAGLLVLGHWAVGYISSTWINV